MGLRNIIGSLSANKERGSFEPPSQPEQQKGDSLLVPPAVSDLRRGPILTYPNCRQLVINQAPLKTELVTQKGNHIRVIPPKPPVVRF